jgi:hypothetical protein
MVSAEMNTSNAYADCGDLADYWNEYAPNVVHFLMGNLRGTPGGFTPDSLEECFKEKLIRTVEERYPEDKTNADILFQIATHPLKVARLNCLARLANANPRDVTLYKQIENEVHYLLYTKSNRKLSYPEPDFDPDLLPEEYRKLP